MSFKALVYAYVLGGLTFLPLLVCAAVAWTIYTSVPVGDPDPSKLERKKISEEGEEGEDGKEAVGPPLATNAQQKPRKAWLTVRRTFEEKETDASYMTMMRTFLDSRSKDPKRSRPKDMWYVVLKGNVLYLYEDEAMTECEAAVQVSSYEVVVFPEGLADGELFTKRNSICLKPRRSEEDEKEMKSVTREMGLGAESVDEKVEGMEMSEKQKQKTKERLEEVERLAAEARDEALDASTPWFIFVRSCVEMEDWYLSLVHASNYHTASSTLEPVHPVFRPEDMQFLVSTLDDQPDVIPMRWLNALIGRVFFSFYRTDVLESFIIGRLMKKLSKVKTPSFLQNISVTEVSVGNTPPTLSKPMLKELTKEGDAALEVRLMYRGEIRLTVEATAIFNLGQRFKTYTVKLVLAVVLRRLDGNLLVKVKRPPTNRLWYAFTQPPDMILDVEPVVSDRQIKWSMILSTIESRLKEIINESVVLPNMDDIAFFESKQYKHRGGIWGDAIRRERTVSEMLDESEQQNPSTSTDNTTLRKAETIDVLPGTIANHATTTSVESTPSDTDVGVRRATSIAAPEMNEATKQKSWFGSTRSTDASSLGASVLEDVQETTPSDRGRGLTVETSSRRATSVPASKSGSASPAAEESEGATLAADVQVDSTTPSSSFSRIRSLSSGAGMGVPSESGDALSEGTSRDSISGNSRGTGSNMSTNASSFLSALKSKTDKQALNNAAKEAMRKWSANWNGFKRSRMATNGESSSQEEHADGVPHSATSSLFSFPTSEGRGYSDIRAAVAQRKDRREHESAPQERPDGASRPIDIPSKGDNVEALDEFDHSQLLPSTSQKNVDTTPSTPPHSGSPRGPTLLRGDSNRSAPSPPKVTTESHIPDHSQLNTTANNDQQQQQQSRPALTFAPPPSPPLQAPPIKTQPSQGAMMTIPGIHASHRGDVMSMGYVAPTPTPPTPAEHKLRTPTIPPTIQNMYRLFKSPTSGASVLQRQQQDSPEPPADLLNERHGSPRGPTAEQPKPLVDVNDDVAPLMLSPSVHEDKSATPAKSTPPPLPPRSTPALSSSSSTPLDPGQSPKTLAASALSASDALKLVAEQDEAKRRSLETGPEAKAGTRSKRSSLGAKRISHAEIPQEFMAHSSGPASIDRQGEPSGQPPSQEAKETGTSEDIPHTSETQHEETQSRQDIPRFGEQSEPFSVQPANGDVVETPDSIQPEPPKRMPPPLPPRKQSLPSRA